ncbi:MAG: methyltransferase domain-containing protein [Coriobacteriia bacterium]|nr:methyltransferase domain-containing protein [Coriobacteriia bacterium]
MLADVVEVLECPHCASALSLVDGRVLACANGHAYDIAREGYANLIGPGKRASTADTPEMVAARREFLARDHFAPLVAAVAEAASEALALAPSGLVLDAGAGTGTFLAAVLDANPSRTGLALDISKHAVRVAARCHPRAGAIVADTWGRLPVRSSAAALVMCVFAPRNAEEFARVLAPGGSLVVVTPQPDHLRELVEALGLITVDPRKPERLATTLSGAFTTSATVDIAYSIVLDASDALAAALMGPSAAHVSEPDLRGGIASLPSPIRTQAAITITTYQPRANETPEL